MLVPPAGTARFRCPPCIFQKWKKQQQRKLPACARPPVPLAPPLPRPSPADATGARQSPGALQQRPTAGSSRRLQGPPSPGTGALFLTQACAPRSGSSRYHPRSPPPACPRQPVPPADTRACHLPPPPPSNAFFPLTLTFAAFASAH
ncbi:proline-rich protein HaeIII subfamily 1-like [Manis pentadactyla]|uniref:proline-rich protein HaeIII subfamily 1-like n=1 Tax=Manis pentadactyla TaxID=143292 RepID=UPI00255C98A1|nr:proline-rich protein HaeIII subfamily 1-like [Manis pentadactyla]XP_057348300.1 proline-rich protein HaeIII subfamily 1-like [Manis pentadactyla]KAI5126052.1 Transcription Elongation Factor Spt5 [Manis pentadactyla]